MLEEIAADLTKPTLWLIVLIWTAIGVVNKLIYYEAGERSGEGALENIHGLTPERIDEFTHVYDRWGAPLLLLASIPILGSVITVLGAVNGVGILIFIVVVAISNLIRNWLIVLLADGTVQLLQ